jgi:arginine/lysine/ornithine decarboxylase
VKNQRRAPICEGVQEFHRSKLTTFTAAGHKARRPIDRDLARLISRDAHRHDVSMMNGVDDRTESKDVQGEAEKLAASCMAPTRLISRPTASRGRRDLGDRLRNRVGASRSLK